MPAPDYGNDYATILPDGRVLLDLSAIRIIGPMVPVVRTLRAWLDIMGDLIEATFTRSELNALASRLTARAGQVEHVLRAEGVTATLGADRVLRVSGMLHVGGSGVYPLNVTVDALGNILLRTS